jgi:tetratricopeptide (TPR) repeat protein
MLRRPLLLALLLALPTSLQAQTSADMRPLAAPADAPRSMADEQARDAASQRAMSTEAWDDALALTLDLVSRYGEHPDYVARLAEIYNRMHRATDETATWERFMVVSPHPDRACPMVGRAYRGLGHYDAAINAFRRCLAADPANVKLVYFVGLGYEWAGQLPAARQYYTRAIAMAPPGHDYRVSLARLDLHQGHLREARDRAAAVLAQVPTHTEGALVAGLAEQRAGHRDGARKFLELAARLAPEYFDVRLALGILDYTESRVPQARGHFEAAFLSDPARRAEVQPWLDRTIAPH